MIEVELTAAEAAGADLGPARELRIVLADGELVGHGARRTVRVPATDVSSMVWLDQPRTSSLLRRGNGPLSLTRDLLGLVVVLGEAGPLLAFYPHDVATIHAGDGRAHLRSSGVEELAAALGVVVEGPTGTLDRSAVTSVLVGHRTWHLRKLLATPLVVAAGIAGFAAGPGPEGWWGPWSLLLGILLSSLVIAWLVAAQRALQRAGRWAPAPGDRVPYPAHPASPFDSRILLGSTSVVAWAGWRLSQRRGPLRRGGITRCRVGPVHTAFLDDRDGAHLVYESKELVPDAAAAAELEAACGQVGIRVERTSEEPEGQLTLRVQPWTFDRALGPDHGLDPLEDAALSLMAPTLLALALLAQFLGSVTLAADDSLVGWIGLVAVAVQSLLLSWTHLRFTSLRRRTRGANPRQVPAPRVDWWRSRIGGPGGASVVFKPSPQEHR